MKRLTALILIMMLVFALAACGEKEPAPTEPDSSDETKAAVTEATADSVVSDNAVVFDFSDYAMDSEGTLYACNDRKGIRKFIESGSGEMIVSESAEGICLKGDTLYYYTESMSESSLHQVKTDGSDDVELCKAKTDSAGFYLLDGDKLYYKEDGLCEYDCNSESVKTLVEGKVKDAVYRDDHIIVCQEKEIVCYDLSKDETVTIDDSVSGGKLFKSENGHICYTKEKEDPDKKTSSYDPNKPVEIFEIFDDYLSKNEISLPDDEMKFVTVYNDTVFYQDEVSDGEYVTYTMSTDTKESKEYKDVDYQIFVDQDSKNFCFQVNHFYLTYDFDAGVFQSLVGVKGVNSRLCAFDSRMLWYEENDEYNRAEMELSDQLPDKNDFYTTALSSPDNEYLRLKKIVFGNYGIVRIPEITLDSEDAAKINSELSELEKSSYGVYYKSELPEHYLTFYTGSASENCVRSYQLYTLDVDTGKQLDNDEIVALITDDRDGFYAKLEEHAKDLQREIFVHSLSNLEQENEDISFNTAESAGQTITDEMVEEAFEDNWLDSVVLGYLGNGKVLCVAPFKHLAGAGGSTHIFEFDYNAY